MQTAGTPGVRLLLTMLMITMLAACTRPSSSNQPGGPQGGAGPSATGPPTSTPDLAPVASAGTGEVVITLFHETHMHGSLLGQDYQGHPADGRTFANYVGVMDQQRQRLSPGSSLFLGDGDDLADELEIPAILGGGAVRTEGRHVLDAFDAAGMDADTFGFDYLPDRTDRLRDVVSLSRFAWVSANVRDGGRPAEAFAGAQGARLWVLKEVGGVQVGITGVVATGYTAGTSDVVGQVAPTITLLDPVQALREVVPKMRAAGAQVVVILSHLFWEQVEQVARQVDGVDVILGSHQGPSPAGYLVMPQVIGRTILSKPGHDMAALGQLDLVVRASDGRVVRYGFQRHPITPDGPSSPAVKAVLDRYLATR